jgi:6-phosphogluconate dehydrogenase
MRIGFIGLGRMGANMVRRLLRNEHEVVAYNRTAEKTKEIAGEGADAAFTIEELVSKLEKPRAVWIMVPAGDATEAQIEELLEHLEKGDTIIDGGNTNFHDDQRRHPELKKKGIDYVDAGVSGGIWGREVGYCLMVGGDEEAVGLVEDAFRSLAPEDGYAHVGPSGSGHFVKMIHNGIEYGLMQAYAEGFEIMHRSAFTLDLSEVAGIWRYGSVVRSWLLELLHQALEEQGDDLANIAPYVEDSGEGRWTIDAAIAESVPAPVIATALFARFASRLDYSYAAKVAAALRNQFGGHAVRAVEEAKARPDTR